MSRQSKTPNLACASVQNMEQNALALFHANRITMTKHPSVDGEGVVSNLVAVRHPLSERSIHCAFAGPLERGDCLSWRKKIHRHIPAATECWLKLLHREKNFAIVPSRIVFGLDINRTDQAAVLTRCQVCSSANVRVVEAEAGRPRHKRDSPAAMRRDERRSFLRCSIYVRRDKLTVPMQ